MRHTTILAAFFSVFAGVLVVAAPATPNLKAVIARANRWVEQFERDFIAVVADEQYDQFAAEGTQPDRHRRIRSELLFLRAEGERTGPRSATCCRTPTMTRHRSRCRTAAIG